MITRDDFACFILTNGRPDRVYTYNTLRRCGYSGKIYLLVDDLDQTAEQYKEIFPGEVIIFNKMEIAKTFDQGDNFNNHRAIIYARNASFKVAEELGIKYFIQLDDDYGYFQYRFADDLSYKPMMIRSLDLVFSSIFNFFLRTNFITFAFSQGGDFIGGSESQNASNIRLKRKAMNSFFCSTDRKFNFVGRINEDVNTYTSFQSKGNLLGSTNQLSLEQKETQSNAGGMTELYLESGTYLKSFYSVMYQPSSVKIGIIRDTKSRIHHRVNWNSTTPMILNERHRK